MRSGAEDRKIKYGPLGDHGLCSYRTWPLGDKGRDAGVLHNPPPHPILVFSRPPRIGWAVRWASGRIRGESGWEARRTHSARTGLPIVRSYAFGYDRGDGGAFSFALYPLGLSSLPTVLERSDPKEWMASRAPREGRRRARRQVASSLFLLLHASYRSSSGPPSSQPA